jgi:predicted GH43/DUF377 family glycosyl hydrolase
MSFLKIRIFLRKSSCFAERKYRWFTFGVAKKLRQFFRLEQPNPFPNGLRLPKQLDNIPILDAASFNISVRGVAAPYNCSIVESGDRLLLFFRFDKQADHPKRPYFTHIGCVELDSSFKQTDKEFVLIDTKSNFSEDPRAISWGDQILLTYNNFLPNSFSRRSIHIASLHPQTLATQLITNLHIDKKPIEKNWTPFIHENTLHFEYYLTPRQVLKVPTPHSPHIEFFKTCWQKFPWPRKWGFPRGGTPAQKIGREYLSFFHSSFRDERGITWYVMAAYTFEAAPPFRITAISRHPLLFKGIYDSPILNTAYPRQRAAFPAGFLVTKDKLLLSLGENDSTSKILTFAKAEILNTLNQLH